ncbi:carbohydrate ABC transporter permease [Candidatus Sumerlaeota bacterium]|nr:carbohydrate ABC transporter permease [Candidatus Sumerlaeota bacterium]
MPILSPVGRKSFKARALMIGMYLLLCAGATTMLYPFLLMISGSTKSAVDAAENRLIPSYLSDDAALYRKHIEAFFNESFEQMQMAYETDAVSFQRLEPPEKINEALIQEWKSFLGEADLPAWTSAASSIRAPVSAGTLPKNLRAFKRELIARFGNRIEDLNRALRTNFVNWNAFWILPENYLQRVETPEDDPFAVAHREFKLSLPAVERYYFIAEGYYKTAYLQTQYTRDIGNYNTQHGTASASWDDVHLPRRAPDVSAAPLEREDWEHFTRDVLNVLWLRLDASAAPAYREYLRAKYQNDIAIFNEKYDVNISAFDQAPLPATAPGEGLARVDWESFLQGWLDPDTQIMHLAPLEAIRIESVEFQFQDFLKNKYGDVLAANTALHTEWRDWRDALPPQQAWHYQHFRSATGALRLEFSTRNFAAVLDYVALHGRGILNTVVYCLLAILAALIVNPLAAYALSRYKPPSAYKMLMFLMLTMAFPPMVTQIPVFLMLRGFGLLNTYWALILPGLANGYAIFLLKGFFDSLPQELYESAAIDGAGEFRVFWQITMSLSQPILAVIALNAFTQAYSNFIMAMLICQDEKMWTLMPWLYQLQSRSGPGVIYASLIIAAIPTFLVFAFCQNIIMRGIVVPVEK